MKTVRTLDNFAYPIAYLLKNLFIETWAFNMRFIVCPSFCAFHFPCLQDIYLLRKLVPLLAKY